MATVPTPGTATTGPLADTLLNGYRDGINWLLGAAADARPFCYVYQNASQSISASTSTTITFDSEVKDTDSMHVNTVGSNQNITIVTPGVYDVEAGLEFSTNASTGTRGIYILQNGAIFTGNASAAATASDFRNASKKIPCVAGDVLTVKCFTSTADTLVLGSAATWFQALWVSE